VGIVASSSIGTIGTGTSIAPVRLTGASRQKNASSAMMDAISAVAPLLVVGLV
jgi:hypothetical protein